MDGSGNVERKFESMDTVAVAPTHPALDDTHAVVETSRAPHRQPRLRRTLPELLGRIDRFVVLERLDEDVVGVAFGAYDELLDRKVTLKVLRGEQTAEAALARDRVLREARVMARLTHPNVARVYEVGTTDGRTFIAMEFVRGLDLGAWLQAAPRTWQARLTALMLAGRGLAAAHAAGVVHRGFRPDRIQLGGEHEDDVKVVGFGPARTASEADEAASADLDDATHLAPEQLAGAAATSLSDQYSFCTTLYTALYGQHPFAFASLRELQAAQAGGKIREPPPGSPVPAGVLTALRRGLALDPARRYPSMSALLAALDLNLVGRRPRWWWLTTIGLVGALAAAAIVGGTRRDVCAGAAGELIGVWDADAATAAQAGVRATGVAYAGETWDRVRPRLDAYGQELVDLRISACRAYAADERSPQLFDRQTACLDQRRASLAALVAILARADEQVVTRATAAAADLPRIAACGDLTALAAALPSPDDPAALQAVQSARETLAQAHAYELAGQAARGLELLAAVAIAEIPHPPLSVEYKLRRGSLLSEAGRHEEADALLSDALRDALALGYDQAAAAVATRREFIRAARLQRARDVLVESTVTAGVVDHVGQTEAGAAFVGDHLNDLGIAHAVLGEALEAEEYFESSLRIRREMLGEDHPQVVYALGNLGLAAVERGALREATGRLQAALTAAEAGLGERHPHVALLAINLGYAHHMVGRYRAADALLRRALALQTEQLGANAPDLQYAHAALGALAVSERRCDDAGRHYGEALRLLEPEGFTHPALLNVLLGMGRAAICRRDFTSARAFLQRSLSLAEQTHGADELRVADVHGALGELHLAAGAFAEAVASYRKVEAIRAAKLPADSPLLGEARVRVGESLRRSERLDEAAEMFERVGVTCGAACESYLEADLRLRLGHLALDRGDPAAARGEYSRAVTSLAAIVDADHPDLALARAGLGRALAAESGSWTPAARALGEQALATLVARGPAFAEEAREVRSWLSTPG